MAKSHHAILGQHLTDMHTLLEGLLSTIPEDHDARPIVKAAMNACAEKMEMCSKAEVAAELAKGNRIMPLNVSAIAPEVPPNLRSVPRHGAPTPATAPVNPLFKNLTIIDERDDWQS